MCDRNDENQDPLQKISRQLSEFASAQQSGHFAPGVGDSYWTQFSGIPPHSGPLSFPSHYPWNPIDVSSSGSTEIAENGNHSIDDNIDSLRNINLSLQNGSNLVSQLLWERNIGSSPHQAFQESGDFQEGFSDVRCTVAHTHSNQPDSRIPVYSSAYQQEGANSSLDRFTSNQNSLSDPKADYISTVFGAHDQGHQNINYPSLSNFISASYDSYNSIPTESQNLEENHQVFLFHDRDFTGSPRSPSFDSTAPSFTIPANDYSKETRRLSFDPTRDNLDYRHSERTSVVDLDLGCNIERRSSANETEISPIADDRHIYAEAVNKWLSFESDNTSPTIAPDFSNSSQTFSDLSCSDLSKPSYSDIAKTPKTFQPSVSKQDQTVCDKFEKNPLRFQRKDTKAFRPFVRQISSGSKLCRKGSLGDKVGQPKMPTNSRYGLDSFDDKILNQGDYNCSSEVHPSELWSRKEGASNSGTCVNSLDAISPQMTSKHMSSEGDASTQTLNERISGKMTVSGSGSSPTANTTSSQKNKKEEELFFDPRRIFQTKNTNKPRASTPYSWSSNKATEQEFMVLNNGKPTASANCSKLSTTAKKHDYINNDLRDNNKLTNQTAAEVVNPVNSNQDSLHRQKESRSRSGKRFSGRSNSSSHRDRLKPPEKRQQPDDSANFEYKPNERGHGIFLSHVDLEKLEEWFGRLSEKLSSCCNWLITILVNLFIYILSLILFVSSSAVHFMCIYVGKCWALLKERVLRYIKRKENSSDWTSQDFLKRKVGLEENIVLPSTGDEAMKRLLSCKGKDPYSILGVKADSSDEDIKRYYRKQAVLVHPDKNQEPGAEEAFKILGHAFEMIGDPIKRRQYDSHRQEALDADAMRAFADLLNRLQTKVQEAANIMACDKCNGKHHRIPVDRPFYRCRYCDRCDLRHSAKEGDVWAESSILGFLWHYYALMDGHVYEITDWMKCHKEFYEHMRANDHAVTTRITNGGKASRRNGAEQNETVEDLISRLFKHGNGSGRQTPGSSHTSTVPGWGNAGPGPARAPPTSGSKKSGRRNKKKRA